MRYRTKVCRAGELSFVHPWVRRLVHTNLWSDNLKERNHVDVRMVIKPILEEQVLRFGTGLNWHSMVDQQLRAVVTR